MTYLLKSVKAIEFYNKNPSLDFDTVNELFVDLIQKITNTIQDSISVNEVKVLLNTIHKKVNTLEQHSSTHQQMLQMMNERVNGEKDFYVQQMKDLIQNRDKGADILSLIREMNTTLIDKTTYSILQQFPKLSDEMKKVQQMIVNDSHVQIQKIAQQEKE